MTTTLRPTGPERAADDGTRARSYAVCVNSRTVGSAQLGTDPRYGAEAGRINALAIDEPDRRRGRGTVAALAAEEVLRHWGCTQVEISVPADAPYALRIADALGYTERSVHMAKPLGPTAHPMPAGSTLRPFTEENYRHWLERERSDFAAVLVERGVRPDRAAAHTDVALATLLPDGVATEGTAMLHLVHDGARVGHVWVRVTEPSWVFSVEVEDGHRGLGHGRALMLAAENTAREAGSGSLQLNVFTGNTPARTLYESLGYAVTARHLGKALD